MNEQLSEDDLGLTFPDEEVSSISPKAPENLEEKVPGAPSPTEVTEMKSAGLMEEEVSSTASLETVKNFNTIDTLGELYALLNSEQVKEQEFQFGEHAIVKGAALSFAIRKKIESDVALSSQERFASYRKFIDGFKDEGLRAVLDRLLINSDAELFELSLKEKPQGAPELEAEGSATSSPDIDWNAFLKTNSWEEVEAELLKNEKIPIGPAISEPGNSKMYETKTWAPEFGAKLERLIERLAEEKEASYKKKYPERRATEVKREEYIAKLLDEAPSSVFFRSAIQRIIDNREKTRLRTSLEIAMDNTDAVAKKHIESAPAREQSRKKAAENVPTFFEDLIEVPFDPADLEKINQWMNEAQIQDPESITQFENGYKDFAEIKKREEKLAEDRAKVGAVDTGGLTKRIKELEVEKEEVQNQKEVLSSFDSSSDRKIISFFEDLAEIFLGYESKKTKLKKIEKNLEEARTAKSNLEKELEKISKEGVEIERGKVKSRKELLAISYLKGMKDMLKGKMQKRLEGLRGSAIPQAKEVRRYYNQMKKVQEELGIPVLEGIKEEDIPKEEEVGK